MAKPYKDPEIQQKITQWVTDNPDRWFTTTYKEIEKETGVSPASLSRYYTIIVAKVAKLSLSEVEKKRLKERGSISQQMQRNKIRQWLKKNPDCWHTTTYKEISFQTGVPVTTLYRRFPVIVAEALKILPSEVKKKRQEEMGVSPRKQKLSDTEIAEIERLYAEGKHPLDIAYLTHRSLTQVEKYKPKETNPDASEDDGETSQRS